MDAITHTLTGALAGQAVAFCVPDARIELGVIGAAVGLLVDLNFASKLVSDLAGWRYHRVLLHNLPVGMFLAATLAGLVTMFSGFNFVLGWIAAMAGVLSHLFLDLLTSHPTYIFYPFSRRGMWWGTSFIIDPILLAGVGVALAKCAPLWGVGWFALYLSLSLLLQRRTARNAERALIKAGMNEAKLCALVARPLAPWRWLCVAAASDEKPLTYHLAFATPWRVGTWQTVNSGLHSSAFTGIAALYRQFPLLELYLDNCTFPRFSVNTNGDSIVIEDIKWWVVLPLRPQALVLTYRGDGGVILRESKYYHRYPNDIPTPALSSPLRVQQSRKSIAD